MRHRAMFLTLGVFAAREKLGGQVQVRIDVTSARCGSQVTSRGSIIVPLQSSTDDVDILR